MNDLKAALKDAGLIKNADQITKLTEAEYQAWQKNVSRVTAEVKARQAAERDAWKDSCWD